jgi:hypothetical protein
MKFKSKHPDPLPTTREIIHVPGTETFYDFVGGFFETEDKDAMKFLTDNGYEAVTEKPKKEAKK